MSADIICAGEMLVEIMRAEIGVPHTQVGGFYRGPFPSGAPCIFIDAAARLAARLAAGRPLTTAYIGAVGADDFGKVLLERLATSGADISLVRIDRSHPTGVAFVQYNADGSRRFIFAPGAAGCLEASDVTVEAFSRVKLFHVTGSALAISNSSRAAVMKALELAVSAGASISFDPNLRLEMMSAGDIHAICRLVIQNTTILLPNTEEARMLTGEANPETACQALLDMGPQVVVLKEGRDGCTVFTSRGSDRASGFAVNEVDPTGAGDTFDAAFVVEYLSGASLVDAARYANAAGALKVTTLGPMASHSREQISTFLEKAAQHP